MSDFFACSKCGGAMQEGFILDLLRAGQMPASWIEGEPEKSIFDQARIKGRARYRIRSFRCTKCGLLENYATDDCQIE
jgi:hypothetical protein